MGNESPEVIFRENMADENDTASTFEEREREAAIRAHAQRMAAIKPAEECGECGVDLPDHRKPWGTCIDCATRAEMVAKGFAQR